MKDISNYKMALGCGILAATVAVAGVVSLCIEFSGFAVAMTAGMAIFAILNFEEAREEKKKGL